MLSSPSFNSLSISIMYALEIKHSSNGAVYCIRLHRTVSDCMGRYRMARHLRYPSGAKNIEWKQYFMDSGFRP